ncbi:MAG TPA: L,D-transpeptidase family protein [Polyangiaceae bacterium]|nr:L,D-transpeptidase family protein [Polyangiaceae bacterium]
MASAEAPSTTGDVRQGAAAVAAKREQLLLVLADTWSTPRAKLQRYERERSGSWLAVAEPVEVNVGRRGMAWGRGDFQPLAEGPRKREGDGKTPAGTFSLRRAFGLAAQLPEGAHGFPYLQATANTYCVEDTRSPHYNSIIDASEVEKAGWQRWSPLKRDDGLFTWGVVVEQNTPHPLVGAGSCVFLHVWRGPGQGTSGCTAMAQDRLVEVLRWLDLEAEPRVVQLPRAAYETLIDEWHLPAL